MSSAYTTTLKLLGDLISTRAMESALQDAARQAGKSAEALTVREIEKVLKTTIYRQLQLSVPAALAKNRIQQTINALSDYASDAGEAEAAVQVVNLERQQAQIDHLREVAKKFGLYFDWPETQKFRSTLQVVETEHGAGRDVGSLLRDAESQRDALERKLAELLIAQAREIAELKADLERVRGVGGPKIRRLENLIHQAEDAQAQQTLVPAEVERARKIANELRKMVESSVVGNSQTMPMVVDTSPPQLEATSTSEFLLDLNYEDEVVLDFGDLSPEQGQRVLEIDLDEEMRELAAIDREFAMVLSLSPNFAQQLSGYQLQHEQQKLVGDGIAALRAALVQRRDALIAEQRMQLADIQMRLNRLEADGVDLGDFKLRASVLAGTLGAQVLVSADLSNLSELIQTLERQAQEAAQARIEAQARLERVLVRQKAALSEYILPGVFADTEVREYQQLYTALENSTHMGEDAEDIMRALAQEHGRLMQSHKEQIDGELAELYALKSQLGILPDLPELSADLLQVQQEIARTLNTLEMGGEVSSFSALLEWGRELTERGNRLWRNKLLAMEPEARSLGEIELADHLIALSQGDHCPDIQALTEEIREARESRQLAVQRDIQEIEASAQEYSKLIGYTELKNGLRLARVQLERGEMPNLDTLWTLLSNLSSESENERASLDFRAQNVIDEYQRYRNLQGETIKLLGRLSDQLRSLKQLSQMSPEALRNYQATLELAENSLTEARSEYEAGRQVVSQLQDPGAMQGLLGVFDFFTTETSIFSEPTPVSKPVPVSKAKPVPPISGGLGSVKPMLLSDQLVGRLSELAKERGVDTLALVQQGYSVWGELPHTGSQLLSDLERFTHEMGHEMGRHAPRLLTLEHASGAAIVLFYPKNNSQLLMNISDVAQFSRLLGQMYRQQHELGALLT